MFRMQNSLASWSLLLSAVTIVKLCSSSFTPTFDSSGALKEAKITAGKEQMNKLHGLSQMPKIGECWTSALEGLQVSCKQLDEDTQARLALKFTSCFNEMARQPSFICGDSDPLEGCVTALDSMSLNTFRDFFLQTQNMCFFLQSELWREATDRSVNQLTSTASLVSKNLEESEERQMRILESQEHSEKLQSGLMKDQNALFNVVVRFKDIFDDLRESVNDHRLIFTEIFEKLTRTQKLVSWIQGEMSLLDMMGFYFISLIFGFIASATRRTRQARFWLVCIAIASLGAERYLFSYLDQREISPEHIQEYIWFLRRVAAGLGVIVLLWCAAIYRDYHALNNNLLADLHGRMEILMEFVNELSKSGIPIPAKLMTQGERPLVKEDKKQLEVNPEPDFANLSTESSSEADTFSNYTNDSERSLDLTNELANLATESEGKGNEAGLLKGSAEYKQPLFQRLFGFKTVENEENIVEEVRRTPSPVVSPNSDSFSHKYNLRQRKTPLRENSVLHSEGPTEFAHVVKKSKKRNQLQLKNDPQRYNYFSSDDEF